MHPFFQVSVLQGLSDRDPERFDWDPERTLRSFLWAILASCYLVLVWHHCRQVFPSCSATQSRPLPFFPPGCTFWVATSIACCLSHLVRGTSTLAVGKVGHLPGDSYCSFYVVHLRTVVFLQIRMISFQSGFCCLTIVFPAPRLPSYRSDTSSFRSCLSLPPGFVSTREAGICAGSRACFTLLFLLDFFLFLLMFVRSFRQPSSKFSSSGIEM